MKDNMIYGALYSIGGWYTDTRPIVSPLHSITDLSSGV